MFLAVAATTTTTTTQQPLLYCTTRQNNKKLLHSQNAMLALKICLMKACLSENGMLLSIALSTVHHCLHTFLFLCVLLLASNLCRSIVVVPRRWKLFLLSIFLLLCRIERFSTLLSFHVYFKCACISTFFPKMK